MRIGSENARFMANVRRRWLVFAGLRYSYRLWTKVAHRLFAADKPLSGLAQWLHVPIPNQLDISWITPHLAVGGRIPAHMLAALAGMGVQAVVDMRSEEQDDRLALARHNIRLLSLQTPDNQPVELDHLFAGARWITQSQRENVRSFVHCQHGVGRSVMVVIATLILQGASLNEAFRLTVQHRWQAGLNPKQAKQLMVFADVLHHRTTTPTIKRTAITKHM